MTEEEKAKFRYRFGGYQFPKMILDGTGPAYAVAYPHPYFRNQPQSWQKGFFFGHPGGNGPVAKTGIVSDADKVH